VLLASLKHGQGLFVLTRCCSWAAALRNLGMRLEDLYDEERDAGLGNGGLGRLAVRCSEHIPSLFATNISLAVLLPLIGCSLAFADIAPGMLHGLSSQHQLSSLGLRNSLHVPILFVFAFRWAYGLTLQLRHVLPEDS
jgi:hypothetical protein